MDAIDNIMYATMRSELSSGELIASPYFQLEFDEFAPASEAPPALQVFTFPIEQKLAYVSLFDHCVIEQSIQKHFWDLNGNVLDDGLIAANGNNFIYSWEMGDGTSTVTNTVSNFSLSSTYHLFYAFLLENTRIVQIFEKVIEKYVYDEELGVAPPDVRQWLLNTESLFYKDGGCRVDNIRSYIRPDAHKNRKNAYYRMFGAELAVGDDKASAASVYKPKTSNQEFIMLFERYLAEIYNAYRHSRSSCCHSVDLNNLRELAIEIRELFACRRGGNPGGSINAYVRTNLAVEEYSSVVMMSWLALMVSDNTPLVNFLGCQSSSIGDRLHRIGSKVGLQAHAQSQALFEMAGSAANVLSIIETGTYLESIGNIQAMITSLNEPGDPTIDSELMNEFLILINNWEKATGHKLKAETQQHAPKEVTVVEKPVVKAVTRAFLN